MPLIEVAPNLYLIALDQDLPGFTAFIGAWILTGPPNILVDAGPASTIPVLVKSLKHLGVDRLDAVLLTHIHIDHAGGVADLLHHYPDTPVVCHSKGLRHLADPAQLWEGSLKTLGDTARAYGPIRPVSAELLCDAAKFRDHGIEPLLTPGHAPHHVSYFIQSYLFAGEAGGIYIETDGEDVYLRPATPTRFFFESYVQSIRNLLAQNPAGICYGHFGFRSDAAVMLEVHAEQLWRWKKIIREEFNKKQGRKLTETCIARILAEDPCLKGFSRLSPAVQNREVGFMQNSIQGFTDYLSRAEDCC